MARFAVLLVFVVGCGSGNSGGSLSSWKTFYVGTYHAVHGVDGKRSITINEDGTASMTSSGGTTPLTWTKTDKGIRLDNMNGKTLMELEYIAGLESKCLELKTKEGIVFKR
jgi:hypothetical protein